MTIKSTYNFGTAVDFDYIEQLLDHGFSDRDLVVCALTHPSATEGSSAEDNYQRLEFLGDSILGAIVAKYLYLKYPTMDEGQLTRMKVSLVSGQTLSNVSRELGLEAHIIMGPSETGQHKRGMKHALEDVYEALVGALYLDAGHDKTRDFVLRTLGPHISVKNCKIPGSPKSLLQQVVQRDIPESPSYTTLSQSGPPHAPSFTCAVLIKGEVAGVGEGNSKKEAESNAALNALEKMGYLDEEEL